MAWGTMRVRNACPFPVTFYALAGPVIEIPANSTRSAKACLIWFSTRCKGGGTVINKGYFEQLQQDYQNQLADLGYDAADYEGGGTGAAAGSILGLAAGALERVFMVKNTRDGHSLYFGAKKEGVYGNADLVIYAELDKACQLDPKLDRLWLLRLEYDHGQQTQPVNSDPAYSVPDLSHYAETVFFRARNVARGTYLSAKDNSEDVGVRGFDVPFNPLTMREYWAVHPMEHAGDGTIAKILNTATNKWLTCFSSDGNRIGLLSQGMPDYQDQHWWLVERSTDPEIVKLGNAYVSGNIVAAAEDRTFLYPDLATAKDQEWYVETCTVDIHKVPPGRPFRLMQASTGQFIAGDGSGNAVLVSGVGMFEAAMESIHARDAHFVLEPHGSDDFRIKSIQYQKYLTFYENDNCLGLYPQNAGDYRDQHWKFRVESHQAGFYMLNQSTKAGGSNHLFHNGQRFGLYGGDYPDQLWVAVF